MARCIHVSDLFIVFDAPSTVVHVAKMVFSIIVVCVISHELVLGELKNGFQDPKERDKDFSVNILDIVRILQKEKCVPLNIHD